MPKTRTPLKFKRNDGGRKKAGFIGHKGDCFVRALTILERTLYAATYETVNEVCRFAPAGDKRVFGRRCYAHHGISLGIIKAIMQANGWRYHNFGRPNSCHRFLCKEDLPRGHLMVRVQTHATGPTHILAVKNHVIFDKTNGASFPEFRVLGYWTRKRQAGRGK